MKNRSFKSRMTQEIIEFAKIYKQEYLDYEYLVCSEAFVKKDFYIIKAEEDNFRHLTGVHSLGKAKEFFRKAYSGTLDETQFDFTKRGQNEKAVKGYARRKMKAFSRMGKMFRVKMFAEETFVKNSIHCYFTT